MSDHRQRISAIAFSPIHADARVLRQLEYLSQRFDVTALGFGSASLPVAGVTMRALAQPPESLRRAFQTATELAVGRVLPGLGYRWWYANRTEYAEAFDLLVASRPDVIVANDWRALPPACLASRRTGAPVLLDLHEFAPRHFENRGYWKALIGPMIDYHLRAYLPEASRIVTVNESLARLYEETYGVECGVVRNIPRVAAQPPFRATGAASVRLVHHGIAVADRRLEVMIDTVAHLQPRFSLHFMLLPKNPAYLRRLRAHAARVAPERVRFHDPVAPADIVPTIAQYDIGLFVLPPVNVNYEHALPNKYFEFIHAGLAVCTGPSVEMARLTRAHACGVVSPTDLPRDVARILNALEPEDIDAYKRGSITARRELTADGEMAKLTGLVDEMLAERGARAQRGSSSSR